MNERDLSDALAELFNGDDLITDTDIEPENVRVAVTLMLPGDMLLYYRGRAKRLNLRLEDYLIYLLENV